MTDDDTPSTDVPGRTDGEPIAAIGELDEGDRVVWGDRVIPCTVVGTGFGSHVIVDGPGQSTYRIQPYPGEKFRLGYRGRTIEGLRRVGPSDGGSS